MATRVATNRAGHWRAAIRRGLIRSWAFLAGCGVASLALALGFALASYHGSDPSMNTAAGGPAENWLGLAGAWTADVLLTLFGLAAVLIVPLLLAMGMRLIRAHELGRWRWQLIWSLVAMLVVGSGLATLDNSTISSLPAGRGGIIGMLMGWATAAGLSYLGDPSLARMLSLAIAAMLVLGGVFIAWRALDVRPGEFDWLFSRSDDDFDDDQSRGAVARPAG